jgi:hypothetical protein
MMPEACADWPGADEWMVANLNGRRIQTGV